MVSDNLPYKNEEKLERILESAGSLFADKDFQNVLMDEIAFAAKVGKGTLYNYFNSKEDLYFSIIRSRLERLLSLLEKAYDSRNDTLKNLRSFVIHLHKFMSKHPHFYLILKREEHTFDRNGKEAIQRLQERIYTLMGNIVGQGVREGVFRKEMDNQLATWLILGMVDSLRKNRETIYEKEEAIDVLLEIIIRGVGETGINIRTEYAEYRHKIQNQQ
ncbi:MAG: TetR/AcrR family transcriptional regulator [Spirochaetales bacterium]|nr:MAG: TetR/AcrR family transcriptional regulator [Spirochaetales bacterium]